ncbi:MAG: DUF1003 domain-containing protein [Actinomycetes bacterium]
MTDASESPHAPLTCPACQVIDKLDGHEDGRLFALEHWSVPNEMSRWAKMARAQDEVADKVTNFAGSLNFVYLHGVWFAIWIIINIGLISAGLMFDKYPFGLLTMIVSLEAIFLSTFVMVSQNRQAARSQLRAQVDFDSNLQSLIWIVHLAQKLDVDIVHVERLSAEAVAESRKDEG